MKKINKIINTPFVRNVMILSSGTVAAQLVSFVLSPIITRLYGPEAYGLMGSFMAVVAMISPVAALTYPIAIVLPKHDSDAKGLVKLSIIVTTIFSIIVGSILLFFYEQIISAFKLEVLAPFFYLIPIVILLSGLLQVMEQWFIRTKQFGVSAKATLFQSIIVNLGKTGIGFFHPVASVLILFSALTPAIKTLLMIKFNRKANSKILNVSFNEKVSIQTLLKKYKDFPLFRAPQVFLNVISQNLPILMLTIFFGPASAGFYSIGRTVLTMPSSLIGKSVGDVFYPRISDAAKNGENLSMLIKKATLALGLVGSIPYGIVVLFGPWLFGFVFGSEWTTAGEYARWVSLWMFFMFINQPSVRALPVLSAQSFHLKFTVFTLTIRVALLAVGYYVFLSDLVAIALFSFSGAVLNLILILLTIQKSRKFFRDITEV